MILEFLWPSPFEVPHASVREGNAASPVVSIRGQVEPKLLALWIGVISGCGNHHEAVTDALCVFVHETKHLAGGRINKGCPLSLDKRIGDRVLHAIRPSRIGIGIHPATQRITARPWQIRMAGHRGSVAGTPK